LFALLASGQDTVPPTYRRAAAFSISRLLAEGSEYRGETLDILLPQVHQPLRVIKSYPRDDIPESVRPDTIRCISTLQNILTNTDPSPSLLSTVFTSIASALYAIHVCLDSKKTVDPGLRDTVEGLLGTWSRIVSTQEVEQVCWNIIEGEGGYWKVDIAGEIIQTARYFFSYILARWKLDHGAIADPRLPKVSRFLPQKR
jgi:hypothetical protein